MNPVFMNKSIYSIHSDEWNADATDYADTHGFEVSIYNISLLSFEKIV